MSSSLLNRTENQTSKVVAPTRTGTQRLVSLDALRGLAALLMVQQHLGVWLVDRARYAGQLRAGLMYINLAGGIAAPLFITLAGVGVALGEQRKAEGRELWLRGVQLIMLGLGLNLMVPSWFSAGSFYVLHLLGVWLIVAPWLARLRTIALLMVCFALLAGAVLGQSWLQTPVHLSNEMMRDTTKEGGWLRLALLEGQFPVFPWLALSCGGLWAGRVIAARKIKQLWIGAALCGGLAGLVRSLAWIDPQAPYHLPGRALCRTSFFPLSSLFALGLFSICLGLLALFVWADAQGKLKVTGLVALGRTSLSLLVFHIVVFRQGSTALGLFGTMTPSLALLIIVVFLTLWVMLARSWGRIGYRWSLEWWLRRT